MSEFLTFILLYISEMQLDPKQLAEISASLPERRYEFNMEKKELPIPFWEWKGGKEIEEETFKELIRAVLSRVDCIPQHENIVNLLYETARVESKAGYYIKQIRGPALGVYQIEKDTYLDLATWLKYKEGRYEFVMSFYDHGKSLEENLSENIVFQTIVCLFHYYRFYGDNLIFLTYTKEMRAKLWKDRFNTMHGKGSEGKYIRA